MLKRSLLATALVLAVFSGYALGQKNAAPLPGNPGGPVFSGGDLGFQADVPLGDILQPGRNSVTGKFVVNVNGKWVPVRSSVGVVPLR